eukprot:Gb_12893 [translate_table: standard]
MLVGPTEYPYFTNIWFCCHFRRPETNPEQDQDGKRLLRTIEPTQNYSRQAHGKRKESKLDLENEIRKDASLRNAGSHGSEDRNLARKPESSDKVIEDTALLADAENCQPKARPSGASPNLTCGSKLIKHHARTSRSYKSKGLEGNSIGGNDSPNGFNTPSGGNMGHPEPVNGGNLWGDDAVSNRDSSESTASSHSESTYHCERASDPQKPTLADENNINSDVNSEEFITNYLHEAHKFNHHSYFHLERLPDIDEGEEMGYYEEDSDEEDADAEEQIKPEVIQQDPDENTFQLDKTEGSTHFIRCEEKWEQEKLQWHSERRKLFLCILRDYPLIWFLLHQQEWRNWEQLKETFQVRFTHEHRVQAFNTDDCPKEHLKRCKKAWRNMSLPKRLWFYALPLTFKGIAQQWYKDYK